MKNIGYFFYRHKGLSFVLGLSLIIQIIGTLMIPYLVGQLIDEGIATANGQMVKEIGIKMLIVALMDGLSAILGSYLGGYLAGLYGYEVRQAFYAKVQSLSILDVEQVGVASLLTRMTSDVANVQRSISMGLLLILPAPIMCVVALGMTLLKSVQLALIPLASIIVYTLIVVSLFKQGLPLSAPIQPRLDGITLKLREFFNGINIIRAFNNQEREEELTNHRFDAYAQSMIRVNQLFAFLTPVAFLIMGLVFGLIIWFGGLLVGSGALQIGVVTAVAQYSILTLFYLILAATVLVTLPRSVTSLNRIDEVLNMTPEIVDQQEASLPQSSVAPPVFARFEDVGFAYQGSEPVLEGISFELKRQQTTAIVGGTGAGKSTIVKVLLNLIPISEGQIIVEGQSSTAYRQGDLRQKISYVPQKAFLFSGTIEANLRLGNPLATQEQLEQAVAIAQAKEFITTQPEGYQAVVAHGGANFSGGQKQRLSIARALVKSADIYIFDDSFSALDYETEGKLRHALQEELPECTFLIIAQRLSTVQGAAHIIVLDEGRIIGQGTHLELLATNQTYQEFALSQGIHLTGGRLHDDS